MPREMDPRRIVQRADKALRGLEDQQVAQVRAYLGRAQGQLERELKDIYQQGIRQGVTESLAWRETRARLMLEDIDRALGQFELSKRTEVQQAFRGLYAGSRDIADATFQEFVAPIAMRIESYDLLFSAGTIDIAIEEIADQVSSSLERLRRHEADTIRKINDVVISGQIRGQGWAKTTGELRRVTGMLGYEAERIVRTESLDTNDRARRKMYAENGIEYVQRVATLDGRICPYCADRAGKVYKVEEAPAALHPNDRCYNMPWKPSWQQAGLTNDDFWESHHRGIKKKLASEGRKPSRGKAPFERMNDLFVPRAVWSPTSGFTAFGKDLGLHKVQPVPLAPEPRDPPPPPPQRPPTPSRPATPPQSPIDKARKDAAAKKRQQEAAARKPKAKGNLTTAEAIERRFEDSIERRGMTGKFKRFANRTANGDQLQKRLQESGLSLKTTVTDRFSGSSGFTKAALNAEPSPIIADVITALDRFEDVFDVPLNKVLTGTSGSGKQSFALVDLGPSSKGRNIGASAWQRGPAGSRRKTWIELNYKSNMYGGRSAARYSGAGRSPTRSTPWVVSSEGRSAFHTTLHEIGHAVDYYLDRYTATANVGKARNVKRQAVLQMRSNLRRAKGPSKYFATNDRERFAEAFNEIMTTPETGWSPAGKALAEFFRENANLFPNRL